MPTELPLQAPGVRRPSRPLLFLAACLPLALASCGGGGGGDEPANLEEERLDWDALEWDTDRWS